MSKLRLSIAAAAALVLIPLAPRAADASPKGSPQRGWFVSIDGLQLALLGALDDAGKLTAPKGFHWLRGDARIYDKAWPVVTTLTAASHVSTVTCTPPSKHGIVANAFLQGGVKKNGFNERFPTEPLWQAVARGGKTAISLAYVGADGTAPERKADFGVAYPDDALMGQSQTLEFDPATLGTTSWQTVTLVLNPKTSETAALHVMIDRTRAEAPEFHVDTDEDLGNGELGVLRLADAPAKSLDVFFTEQNGVKRRAFLRLLPKNGEKLVLYVSKASYNNAYPEALRQRLDALDLVWPDYGVRATTLSALDYVETQAMIDRFLTDVAARVAPELGVEVTFFYQPLIDSVGHKWQSALPQPFDPSATDDVTRAYVRAFQIVDENLGKLFARASERDVVMLMGDHGMDATRKVVNLAALLTPEQINQVDGFTSGALAFLYRKGESTAADQIGAALRDALQATVFEEKPALGKAYEKAAGQDAWSWGEAAWAYTAPTGLYYVYNPLSRDVFVAPGALGMHGHALDVPTMATTLLVKAPGVKAGHEPETSLLNAAPTFARLMGVPAPKDCEGRSLVP